MKHRALALAAAVALLVLTGCGVVATPTGWAAPVASQNRLLLVQDSPGQIVALNPQDVTEVWRFPDSVKTSGGGALGDRKITGTLYASPVVDAGAVYLASYEGRVTRLDYDGPNLTSPWEVVLEDVTLVATPRLQGDRLIVLAEDGTVFVLSTKDGGRIATYRPTKGRVWGAPAMRGSVIYVGSLDNSDLVALNVDTGTTEWRKELAGATAAGVTVDGDTIIVASFDRALHSLDAAAGGTERWRFEGDGWFVGTPLVTKDAIYAATMRGTVYAVDKSGKQIWSRAHPDREFRSSPILAGDTLVIAARDGTILGLNVADGAEKWSTEPQGAIDADGLLLESSLFYITTSRALLRVDPADGAIRSFNTQPPDGSK